MFNILGALTFVLIGSLGSGFTTDPSQFSAGKITLIFFGYIGFLFFAGLGLAVYAHKKLSHFWGNSEFGPTRFSTVSFRFSGSLSDIVKVYVGNFVLVVITLGLAFPITQMRIIQYMVTNMTIEGGLDLGQIGQSSEAEPSFGEGLAEGFDMGTI